MEPNIKLAAQKLLKIAEDLEREASNSTYFVCDVCNHTASLASINEKRRLASEQNNVQHVANVTVNDSIKCIACGGKMSYVPTDESSKFYLEAEDVPEEVSEELDIFEPVDDQEKKKEEQESPEGLPESEEPVIEEAEPSEVDKGPEKDMPLDVSDKPPEDEKPAEEDVPELDEPVIEETVSEDSLLEEKPPKPKKEKKKNNIEIPKEDVPKFEKMPKEAMDAFLEAVVKYSI